MVWFLHSLAETGVEFTSIWLCWTVKDLVKHYVLVVVACFLSRCCCCSWEFTKLGRCCHRRKGTGEREQKTSLLISLKFSNVPFLLACQGTWENVKGSCCHLLEVICIAEWAFLGPGAVFLLRAKLSFSDFWSTWTSLRALELITLNQPVTLALKASSACHL